jgi:hypothetical protein
MPRQASLLVCDDLLVSMNGKFTALGVYSNDIVVPAEGASLFQLVFLFIIETASDDLFTSLKIEIVLPDQEPVRAEVPVASPAIPIPRERKAWLIRWPLLLSQPFVKPGRISAKIIHERGEIPVSAPWVTAAAPRQAIPV